MFVIVSVSARAVDQSGDCGGRGFPCAEWRSIGGWPSLVLTGRSAPGLDGAGDLGGEFGVDQKLVDECGEDFLSGHAGDSEAVGGLSLPDVECAVCCGWEVDGASCSLGTCRLVVCRLLDDSLGVGLSEAGEALGWCRVCGWGGRGGGWAEWPAVGFVVTWVDAQLRRPFCLGPV
jgi:hypothetical protein